MRRRNVKVMERRTKEEIRRNVKEMERRGLPPISIAANSCCVVYVLPPMGIHSQKGTEKKNPKCKGFAVRDFLQNWFLHRLGTATKGSYRIG